MFGADGAPLNRAEVLKEAAEEITWTITTTPIPTWSSCSTSVTVSVPDRIGAGYDTVKRGQRRRPK